MLSKYLCVSYFSHLFILWSPQHYELSCDSQFYEVFGNALTVAYYVAEGCNANPLMVESYRTGLILFDFSLIVNVLSFIQCWLKGYCFQDIDGTYAIYNCDGSDSYLYFCGVVWIRREFNIQWDIMAALTHLVPRDAQLQILRNLLGNNARIFNSMTVIMKTTTITITKITTMTWTTATTTATTTTTTTRQRWQQRRLRQWIWRQQRQAILNALMQKILELMK